MSSLRIQTPTLFSNQIDGNDLRETEHAQAVSYFHATKELVTLLVERGAERRILVRETFDQHTQIIIVGCYYAITYLLGAIEGKRKGCIDGRFIKSFCTSSGIYERVCTTSVV